MLKDGLNEGIGEGWEDILGLALRMLGLELGLELGERETCKPPPH